jgi:hypothetical protein
MRTISDIVYDYPNDALMSFEAWLLHITGAISCCRRLVTGLMYVPTALRLLGRHYAGDFSGLC